MLCGSLDGRGIWGRMDTICMVEFLRCPPTLLISYTPIKLKVRKKYHHRPPPKQTLASNEGGVVLTPGQGARMPHVLQPKTQNIKQKQCCNKFNKDYKNGLQ